MGVKVTEWYEITVIVDGIKASDHYFAHAIEAVEAWNKFYDYGDAKEVRTIVFIPPYGGEIRTKHFLASNRLKASK
jgi:hypothetical protein